MTRKHSNHISDGMGANAIQIKVGITVNPDVSVKTSYI